MLFQLKKAQIDDFCYWFSVSTLGSSLVLIKIGSSDVVSFTGNWYGYYKWNPKTSDFQTKLDTKSSNIVSSK